MASAGNGPGALCVKKPLATLDRGVDQFVNLSDKKITIVGVGLTWEKLN